MGHVSFRGAYALFGDFARLERALMSYAFEKLTQNVGTPLFAVDVVTCASVSSQGFKLVSVPDIIHRGIIVSNVQMNELVSNASCSTLGIMRLSN